MADTCLFVVVEIALGIIGLIAIAAAVVEFVIWVRYTDREIIQDCRRVRASPIVAVVWFMIGFAMLAMMYLVLLERLQ